MSMTLPTSRRRLLRLMAGAPLIPIAGFLAPSRARATTRQPMSAEFIGMGAPTTPTAQATTTVESSLIVTYDDGTTQSFSLGYQPLFFTGDAVPDGQGGTVIAGGYVDAAGNPLLDPSAQPPVQFFSDCPDGYTLLPAAEGTEASTGSNQLFAVVQFEYTTRDAKDAKVYGQLPSPIAVLTLDQDKSTGALRLVKYHTVDASPVHGLWTTCGASLSPWGTHLSSEEYEPDAVTIADNAEFKAFSRNYFGDPAKAKPYHYGHIPEVFVNSDGTGKLVKHYCLGRISHELVQVMPDRRTLLMGDDMTNAGLFMFVADEPADLSAGTLYAAKVAQRPNEAIDRGGAFDLQWIKLGHATSAEIEALADKLTAADIVEAKEEDPQDPSFTPIHFGGEPQWVRFKPGMEKAAAFLETHRWAPTVGATLAFSKVEGVTVNAADRAAYLALSYIYKSMTDGESGIQVAAIEAGAVYQLPMQDGQRDAAGEAIDSEWVPVHMAAVPALIGRDLPEPDALGNKADPELVANPDNIKFSERLRTLFIGEDSSNHFNNFIWAYNVDSGKLARILSCPAGAEATGLEAVDDLNGFAYIMSNFQHPGDWGDGLPDKVEESVAPLIDRNYRQRRSAAIGYIHGLPQLV